MVKGALKMNLNGIAVEALQCCFGEIVDLNDTRRDKATDHKIRYPFSSRFTPLKLENGT